MQRSFGVEEGRAIRLFQGARGTAEALAAFEATKQRQKAISIKLPQVLMERTWAESKRRRVPYQTLIKIVLKKSLDRLGAA